MPDFNEYLLGRESHRSRIFLWSAKQTFDNAEPFPVERLPALGFTSPTIPVGGVALVALLTVQIGVYPRSLDAFILLRGLVRPRPIALGIPPQSGEGVRESGWRLGRGQRLTEFVRGDLEFPLHGAMDVASLARNGDSIPSL